MEKHLPDFPFYFGNTLAVDFLNLRQNEWKAPHSDEDPCLDNDYAILSVGCGDIRSLVNSIAQLPEEFHGKISITMCDYDPFVMARNILFLYMMVKYAAEPDFGKTLATIWYSIRLSCHDYHLLQEALKDLSNQSEQSVNEFTEGLVEMEEEEVAVLRQVWTVWLGMECRHSEPDSINLTEQRKQQRAHVMMSYLKIPRKYWESYMQWQLDGIIASVAEVEDMPYYNPTLTGGKGVDATKVNKDDNYKSETQPKDLSFVYCIQADAEPFHVWDFIEIKKHAAGTDYDTCLPIMFHAYVSHIIQKAVDFISKEKRVTIKMTMTDCMKLELDCEFDRIFTSNLLDYIGAYSLAHTFGPMLNRGNKLATLVMDTLFGMELWEFMVDQDEFCTEETKWQMMASVDGRDLDRDYIPHLRDYIYDATWFMRLLKSFFMASPFITEVKVPSSRKVLEFNDLKMRDVRKGLNTVVPYYYLKGPRQGGSVTSRLRVIEWVVASPAGTEE